MLSSANGAGVGRGQKRPSSAPAGCTPIEVRLDIKQWGASQNPIEVQVDLNCDDVNDLKHIICEERLCTPPNLQALRVMRSGLKLDDDAQKLRGLVQAGDVVCVDAKEMHTCSFCRADKCTEEMSSEELWDAEAGPARCQECHDAGNGRVNFMVRAADGTLLRKGTLEVLPKVHTIGHLKNEVVRVSRLRGLFASHLRADGPYDNELHYMMSGDGLHKRKGFKAPNLDEYVLSTCGIRAGDTIAFHRMRFRYDKNACYGTPLFELPDDNEEDAWDESYCYSERFHDSRELFPYLNGDPKTDTLCGQYDIVFASINNVDWYETHPRALSPIMDGRVMLCKEGGNKIKGRFFADASAWEKKLGKIDFAFDENFPYEPKMKTEDSIYNPDAEEEGEIFPANIMIPIEPHGRMVHLKSIPGGLQTSTNKDSAYNPWHAFIYLFTKDELIPRGGEGWGRMIGSTSIEVEKSARAYESKANSSWIHNHLNVPDNVANHIFEFWRTEPPPALVFRKGGVLVACGWGEERPMIFICRRSDQEQRSKVAGNM